MIDEDGSLTDRNEKTYLTPYYPHLENVTECQRIVDKYNDSAACSGLEILPFMFRNAIPYDEFVGVSMKILNLANNCGS